MIDSSDISVVIQGPIARPIKKGKEINLTADCIASLRRVLPHAEIILSTWENADTTGLTPDILVTSKDPGATISSPLLVNRPFPPSNVNRQIVSTFNGIRRATRRYTLKARSDVVFDSCDFLKYYDRFPLRDPAWSLFQQRLLACTHYAVNPRVQFLGAHPFHPSDWFFFGLTTDLLDLWDIPLADKLQRTRWFADKSQPVPDYDPFSVCRYAPEQYIWFTFLSKYVRLNFDIVCHRSGDIVETSERYHANNLVLLSPRQIGMQFKKNHLPVTLSSSIYTHGDWLRLYQRYCDPLYKPGWDHEKPVQLAVRGLRFILRPVRIFSDTYKAGRQ